ncbi:MAG: DUF4345 domain-containing protein [Pseudomonadota bacterium]
MKLAAIILWLFGLITLAFGVWALLAPTQFAALAHYGLDHPGAVTELRAFYGGVEIGLGVFWILGALRQPLTRAALVSMISIWSGVVIARGLGLVLDGSGSTTMLVVLGTEIAAVIGAAIALNRLPASQ